MRNEHDGTFAEIVREMDTAIERGYIVFQKFTCGGCGARQNMDVPNSLYTSGHCEECGHVTNLQQDGCGFKAVLATEPFYTKVLWKDEGENWGKVYFYRDDKILNDEAWMPKDQARRTAAQLHATFEEG